MIIVKASLHKTKLYRLQCHNLPKLFHTFLKPKIIFFFSGFKLAMPPCVSDKAKDCQRTFFGNFNQKNPFNENDSFKGFFLLGRLKEIRRADQVENENKIFK
jgi:hypothetical protein